MPPFLEFCPICGAPLQATRRQFLSQAIVNASGELIAAMPERTDEIDVFCENAHRWPEMNAAICADEEVNL